MRKANRRKNKQTKKELLARQSDAGLIADESLDPGKEKAVREAMNLEPQDDAEAGVGDLFSDPRLLRSDATLMRRFVAERISCGAIDPKLVKQLIGKMVSLAAGEKDSRKLSRALLTMNALQLAELKFIQMVDDRNTGHNQNVGGQHIHFHGGELPEGYNRKQGESLDDRKKRLLSQLKQKVDAAKSDVDSTKT